jgi:hypothetical protein
LALVIRETDSTAHDRRPGRRIPSSVCTTNRWIDTQEADDRQHSRALTFDRLLRQLQRAYNRPGSDVAGQGRL